MSELYQLDFTDDPLIQQLSKFMSHHWCRKKEIDGFMINFSQKSTEHERGKRRINALRNRNNKEEQ